MAIKELFYDNRPQVLLDPRASQRIDPRFKFTRNSTATYFDKDGVMRTAPVGAPRYEYNKDTGTFEGLLIEQSSSNLFQNSHMEQSTDTSMPTNWGSWNPSLIHRSAASAPNGVANVCIHGAVNNNGGGVRQVLSGLTPNAVYTISVYARRVTSAELAAFIAVHGATTGTTNGATNIPWVIGTAVRIDVTVSGVASLPASGAWVRVLAYATADGTGVINALINTRQIGNDEGAVIALWGAQAEPGLVVTSLIQTPVAATATRSADLLSTDAVSVPATGSVFIDSKSTAVVANGALVSLANPSNAKINLSYASNSTTYNSLALIASYNGTSKSSLPLPVPTTARERNIITWGANNYQYGRDSSRYATSLSSSVPTGLNKLSIGHDAVDPTKAFNGYINTVYAWSGELTPAVAEALVRNDLTPINADTYSPVGPAGSLALVINTQGATASGEKTFTLPADRASYAATALVTGQTYRILTVGTTDFTLIGAASNTVGVVFTATGAGTGTGTAAYQNDIVITWGDGTESGLDGTDAEVGSAALTHTYPAAGIYPVWVEGQMENIQFNNIANAPDLLQIAAWGTNVNGNNVLRTPSTMANAFYGCTQMNFSTSARTANLPDTSAVTNWSNAFRVCSSITGTFPAFNFSAATTFSAAWFGCSSMSAFTAAGDQTQNVTDFNFAWEGCSSLTSFPQINTSAATSLSSAWANCSNLASFPLINTSSVTSLSGTWSNCANLDNIANAGEVASFPLINTSSCSNFRSTWFGCSSMTAFPLINVSSATDFTSAWFGCSGLLSFPALQNTGNVTSVSAAWQYCSGLTSFPVMDFSSVTDFLSAWSNTGLTSFPSTVDVSAGTNFGRTWRETSITTFPLLNFTAVTALATDDVNSYTGFRDTWRLCSSLANFPANAFSTLTCTRYLDAFTGCALTAASIENILVSINAANTSNGNLGIGGGTNAAKSTWTSAANTAYDALVARGWTITYNA